MRTVFAYIQLWLRIFLALIVNHTGKSRQNIHIIIFLFLYVSFDFMVIADSSQSGWCNHHHLSFTANHMSCGTLKCLHNNLWFLTDIIRVQFLIFADDLCRPAGRNIRIIRHGLCNSETGIIGHIILKDIKDKFLLNRLPHTIHMKRLKWAVRLFLPKHFQRGCLWRSSKCKKRQILMFALRNHFFYKPVLRIDFFLRQAFTLHILPQSLFRICQCSL